MNDAHYIQQVSPKAPVLIKYVWSDVLFRFALEEEPSRSQWSMPSGVLNHIKFRDTRKGNGNHLPL